MGIQGFRDLRVYQDAFRVAQRLFEHSKAWPKEEQYALTDQIRRSSRSVCANLAEAWAKRRYPNHFVSKLTDADAEARETQCWLDFATSCGYLTQSERQEVDEAYNRISGGLVKMMRHPEQWCGPSNLIREDPEGYNLN